MTNKKLIVITGASSGFGAEIAKIFNQAGNPLLLIGRNIAKMEDLPLDFTNIMLAQADVTNLTDFTASIRTAEAKFGPTDLLVNNAGVMLLGNVENQSSQEWQTMLDTNVMGVLNGTQIVLQNMIDRQGGTIINMSSIAGFKAFINHAAYVASKFGVHGATETIRQEVASKNVRVSLVAPGAAETNLLTHVTSKSALNDYQAWKESMGGLTLDPKYVAQTVKFIYDLPQAVEIREVDIAATRQDA